MKNVIVFVGVLSLSGCLLTVNPIGMLGIIHHKSHSGPICPPKDKHCIDDSGMRGITH